MPAAIILPNQIEESLKSGTALHGQVKVVVAKFNELLGGNTNLPFFPEYTEHHFQHCLDVLNSAVGFMNSEAKAVTSPGDMAVLTIAVMLHDCAMHLTEDAFLSLIGTDPLLKPITDFENKPWNVLWEDFFSIARRYDDQKCISLFGKPLTIRQLPASSSNWDERDRMFIGEFIRTHHARLAHQIALYGFPGKKGTIDLLAGIDPSIRGISGLVARSHGMVIRDCFDCLQSQYGSILIHKEIHSPYLMALLRLADYSQVLPERAPFMRQETKKIKSPISEGEWRLHHCISDVRRINDDPEAISVFAHPKEVETFFRLKDWLSGFQKELDMSWAVLGELYGRFEKEGLNKLGLSIRRIKSNIDDIAVFSKHVNYVPARISFEAAGPDLLKLLVGPLYNDEPLMGIRELVQNSTDAVRELDEFSKGCPGLKIDRIKLGADVVVSAEISGDKCEVITVTDRGIGMNLEVIQNYFFKAGASFRRSESWKKAFEDEKGNPKVIRSGKFGVGVLAAFLIGDEIEVTTRHVEEQKEKGLHFKASIDQSMISVQYISQEVGTRIRIKVNERNKKRLAAAFDKRGGFVGNIYCGAYPIVRFEMIAPKGEKIVIPHALTPKADAEHGKGWRCLKHEDFGNIHWYQSGGYFGNSDIAVNGISVIDYTEENVRLSYSREKRVFFEIGNQLRLLLPTISMHDYYNKLDLNLQRTKLLDIPFKAELAEEMLRDILTMLLTKAPQIRPLKYDDEKLFDSIVSPSSYGWKGNVRGYIFETKSGFSLVDKNLLSEAGITRLMIIYRAADMSDPYFATSTYSDYLEFPFKFIVDYAPENYAVVQNIVPDEEDRGGFRSEVISLLFRNGNLADQLGITIEGMLVVVPTEQVFEYGNDFKENRGVLKRWTNQIQVWGFGKHPDNLIYPSDKVDEQFSNNYFEEYEKPHLLVAELYLRHAGKGNESFLFKTWMNAVGQPIIPWEKDKREDILKAKQGILKQYIDLYKEERCKQEKRQRAAPQKKKKKKH